MYLYFTIVIFFLGLAIASFLNALLYRIDNGYKYPEIFIKSSHCEKCNKILKWYELIPVLSFFIFKGKCKQCEYKVPLYYPFSELLLAISLSSVYYFSLPITIYILMIFLFVMSYFDRIYKGIPKDIIHIFLLYSFLSFVTYTVIQKSIQENSLIFALLFVFFVFLLTKVLKKKFGSGDLLILLGLGFLISTTMYVSFLYTFLFVALIYSAILMILKKANIKSSIPLVPIMFFSFTLMILLNSEIALILNKIFYI